LNYDWSKLLQLPESLMLGTNQVGYQPQVGLQLAGKRSMLNTMMFSDTQDSGLVFSVYGDASVLVTLQLESGTSFQYYILTPLSAISDLNTMLSTFEVLKIYCASFDWGFSIKANSGLCFQYNSRKDINFTPQTIVSFDTATQRIIVDQSIS
jgi:hypothetical protein